MMYKPFHQSTKFLLAFVFTLTSVNFLNGQDAPIVQAPIAQAPIAELAIQNGPYVESDCGCDSASCGNCGITRRARRFHKCPQCQNDGICQLKTEEVKEKKTCFKVETKKICIPAVRMPWQSCVSQCGQARTIKVLKKETYECPKCEYSWEVVEPECLPFETGEPVQEQAVPPQTRSNQHDDYYQGQQSPGNQYHVPIVKPIDVSRLPPAPPIINSPHDRPSLFRRR